MLSIRALENLDNTFEAKITVSRDQARRMLAGIIEPCRYDGEDGMWGYVNAIQGDRGSIPMSDAIWGYSAEVDTGEVIVTFVADPEGDEGLDGTVPYTPDLLAHSVIYDVAHVFKTLLRA